ncbi:MAG: hypothetical protein ACK5MT_00740 [Actinomycetales bacterium]
MREHTERPEGVDPDARRASHADQAADVGTRHSHPLARAGHVDAGAGRQPTGPSPRSGPGLLGPAAIRQLQRTGGNRAVATLMRARAGDGLESSRSPGSGSQRPESDLDLADLPSGSSSPPAEAGVVGPAPELLAPPADAGTGVTVTDRGKYSAGGDDPGALEAERSSTSGPVPVTSSPGAGTLPGGSNQAGGSSHGSGTGGSGTGGSGAGGSGAGGSGAGGSGTGASGRPTLVQPGAPGGRRPPPGPHGSAQQAPPGAGVATAATDVLGPQPEPGQQSDGVPGVVSASGPPAVPGGEGSGVVSAALATLSATRAGVIEAATSRRRRVQLAADTYRRQVAESFSVQSQRVQESFEGTVNLLRSDLAQRTRAVRGAESEHLARAGAAASAERQNLQALRQARHAQLDAAARTSAEQIRTAGSTQAGRSIAGAHSRAQQATGLVDARAAQAQGNEGSEAFIRSIRRGKLPDVQQRLRAAAHEVAGGVREQAGEVASHITGEAAQGRAELTSFFAEAGQAVADSHTETTRAVREAADAAVASLQDAVLPVIARLTRDRDARLRELRSGQAGMTVAIDRQVSQSVAALDRGVARDLAELDWAIGRVAEGGGEPISTQQAVADIGAQVELAQTQHDSTADSFAGQVDQAAGQATGAVDERASQVVQGLATLGGEVTGRLAETAQTTRGEMGRALAGGTTQMRNTCQAAQTTSATAVGDAATAWQGQVRDQGERLTSQVDDSLARQDTQLAGFATDLDAGLRDSRAERSEGGFLSSVGAFFSGLADFLVGVVEGIGLALFDLLKGLWTLVTTVVGWVIIAVVVIVAVIVVVVFGWEVLLIALAVIGVVVGLSMAGYYLYLAFTRPDLTWRERGRLVGRALFEIALAALSLAELRGLTSITKLGLIAKLAQRLGGMGNAIRAIRILGSVERALQILDRVGDAALAMRLITSVRRFEDIVRLLDELGTAARVLELITHFGSARALLAVMDALGTGARLEACIAAFGGAGELARVIQAIGGAERLARYLGQVGGDAAVLARLMDEVGGAAAFARYVRALGDDAAQLVTLIDDVGGAAAFLRYVRALGDDAARLRLLITRCGSVEDFRALLRTVGDDIVRLETMLRNAGNDPVLLMDLLTQPGTATVDEVARLLELIAGDVAVLGRLRAHVPDLARLLGYLEQAGLGNAGRLADLLDLAVARGFAVDRVERILALANGAPGEFRRLVQALNRFPFPAAGAAPNAPVPISIATGRFSIGAARIVAHRMAHYLERHVDIFFRFTAANMNLDNTLWPAGTAAGDVARLLDEALALLQAQGRLTAGNLGTFQQVTLGNGVTVRVMVDSLAGNLTVVSFHPVGGPGVVNFVLEEMRAFRALVTGVP